MYDIAIIGAGPAGATLARLIGRQYKVLLVDKRTLTPSPGAEPASKCCGGLLAPDAQKMLAAMGLGLPHHVLAGPQLFAVRTIDVPGRLERYYQRSYLNIDRGRFDRWLVSLIPPGVDVLQGCLFNSLERYNNEFLLDFTRDGSRIRERAKIVVGADGAFSRVRKLAFPDDAVPATYIAIQERFEAGEALPYFTALFDPEITDFYSWIIPKDSSLLVGSALQRGATAPAKFSRLKEKLRTLGFAFGPSFGQTGSLLLRPLRTSQVHIGGNDVALIGEAAGWISPSSAEGISYAFRSALALAKALGPGLDDFLRRYDKNTRSLRLNIVLKNLKSPFMYSPLLRKLVMKSGLKSIKTGSL